MQLTYNSKDRRPECTIKNCNEKQLVILSSGNICGSCWLNKYKLKESIND